MMKVISIVFGMQYLLYLTQCFNIAFLNNRNVSYCILWNHYCIARVRLLIKTALFNILPLQSFVRQLYLTPTRRWNITKKRSGTREWKWSTALCFFFIRSLYHTINPLTYASISCNMRFILLVILFSSLFALVLRTRANNWRK